MWPSANAARITMPAWRHRRPTNGAKMTNDDVSCASVQRLSERLDVAPSRSTTVESSVPAAARSSHQVARPTSTTVATLATTM